MDKVNEIRREKRYGASKEGGEQERRGEENSQLTLESKMQGDVVVAAMVRWELSPSFPSLLSLLVA